MFITLDQDPYRDNGYNTKYIAFSNDVITSLINLGIIGKNLKIIKDHKDVIRAFFQNDLDVYIDGVKYCSDCHKKRENKIHCQNCNQCKPYDEFDDDDCVVQVSRCLRQPLAEDYITVEIDDAFELYLSIDEVQELAAEMIKAAHCKVGSDE